MIETQKAAETKHPFILEKIYRMVADQTTDGDLTDAGKVLQPLLDMYLGIRDEFFNGAYKAATPEYSIQSSAIASRGIETRPSGCQAASRGRWEARCETARTSANL